MHGMRKPSEPGHLSAKAMSGKFFHEIRLGPSDWSDTIYGNASRTLRREKKFQGRQEQLRSPARVIQQGPHAAPASVIYFPSVCQLYGSFSLRWASHTKSLPIRKTGSPVCSRASMPSGISMGFAGGTSWEGISTQAQHRHTRLEKSCIP